MIVQQLRTGRGWGDKRDTVRGRAKIGSATIEFEEFDHWDGPVTADGKGEYVRATRIFAGRMQWPASDGEGA